MAVRRGVRRSEGFAVRRWLQLGAASAGVGAGLLGFSLLGPQVGTAAADTAGESSTTSSASTSDGAASSASTDAADDAGADADDADDNDDSDDSDDSDDADEADDADDADTDEEDTSADDLDDGDLDDDLTDEDIANEDIADDADDDASDDGTSHDSDATSSVRNATEDVVPESKSQSQARVAAPKVPAGNWSDVTGEAISTWTKDSQGWINSLPVDNQAKYHLEGALWATRRTFLNQAPDVAPVQISGKLDGPVVGTVGAVDPDGDRLIYIVTRGPRSGSVDLNADGTYTYTPGADFDGVDTFRVVAVDVGPHVNLLDPFRRIGTGATNLVNQRAITFAFNYTTGADHWTPERREALGRVADELVEYFMVTRAVTVTYDVMGEDDAQSTTLAWADSDLISEEAGFWRTVVQNKLQSGIDSNGAEADGEIAFNFGNEWALGDIVGSDEYDFTSTAIHEILHSFGFMATVGAPGTNDGDNRVIYDRFIVTADGVRPVGADYVWDDQYDPNLVGENGGLYFGGSNAVAAYGGFVPLFTPAPWRPGSSVHHLDDFTFTGPDQKVMNAMSGTGFIVRALSPVEVAILRDLGYRVSAPLVQL